LSLVVYLMARRVIDNMLRGFYLIKRMFMSSFFFDAIRGETLKLFSLKVFKLVKLKLKSFLDDNKIFGIKLTLAQIASEYN
jgi:hypothetical protein